MTHANWTNFIAEGRGSMITNNAVNAEPTALPIPMANGKAQGEAQPEGLASAATALTVYGNDCGSPTPHLLSSRAM